MGKLTAIKVKSLLEQPGSYSDGEGLILKVGDSAASWVVRVQRDKKRRDYGIGSAKLYSLSEARSRAWEVRRAVADGRDPRTLWTPPPALLRTFREAAEGYLTTKTEKIGGKGQKQDRYQLTTYAFPALGSLQVQSVDADRIAECLRPIWQAKPETARQVRSLIERALRYTRPDGAMFVGALSRAISDRLPPQPKKGHFTALPYQDVPALMERLAQKLGIGAMALRFSILCASRSGEVRGAKWAEFDLDRGVWTIPAERMKMRTAHRVPLSPQARAVLNEAAAIRRAGTDLVFPNGKGAALSDMALTKTLRDMGMECTAHGFRSSFRDWAAETSVDDAVAEAALAHAVSDKVVAAYKRTTFDELRRELMDAWGRFASGDDGDNVVELAAAR